MIIHACVRVCVCVCSFPPLLLFGKCVCVSHDEMIWTSSSSNYGLFLLPAEREALLLCNSSLLFGDRTIWSAAFIPLSISLSHLSPLVPCCMLVMLNLSSLSISRTHNQIIRLERHVIFPTPPLPLTRNLLTASVYCVSVQAPPAKEVTSAKCCTSHTIHRTVLVFSSTENFKF